MARKVKTIAVDDVKARANQVFRDSGDEFKTGRAATKLFAEDILMKTGNYKGFRYLSAEETGGKSFGIRFAHDGSPIFPDQTRVAFL
jgi:hypothetical protein